LHGVEPVYVVVAETESAVENDAPMLEGIENANVPGFARLTTPFQTTFVPAVGDAEL
jgi:hypothetical protein